MFLKKNATWTLDLKDIELTVIRKCMRGDELTDTEEQEAERLICLIDGIVQRRSPSSKPQMTDNRREVSLTGSR